MQKLVAIPMSRYNNLVHAEKTHSGLQRATDAIIKNQETQDLLQRQKQYKELEEDVPKSLDKVIPKTPMTTMLPPKRERQKNKIKAKAPLRPAFFIPMTKTFKPNKKRTKKEITKPITAGKQQQTLGKWVFSSVNK